MYDYKVFHCVKVLIIKASIISALKPAKTNIKRLKKYLCNVSSYYIISLSNCSFCETNSHKCTFVNLLQVDKSFLKWPLRWETVVKIDELRIVLCDKFSVLK